MSEPILHLDLEVLEKRVRDLEYKLYSNKLLLERSKLNQNNQRKPFSAHVLQEEQILFRLEQAIKKYAFIDDNCIRDIYNKLLAMDNIFKKETLIEEQKEKQESSIGSEFNICFNKAEKIQLLLNEEKMVDELCKHLEKLEQLVPLINYQVPKIDINELQSIAERCDKMELEAVLKNHRIQTLLKQYNEIISLISQKFIHWDRILTFIERQMDQLSQIESKIAFH